MGHRSHLVYAPYNIWNIILELFIVYLKLKLTYLATLSTGHHWVDSVKAEYFAQHLIHLFLSHWTESDLKTWACLLMYPLYPVVPGTL